MAAATSASASGSRAAEQATAAADGAVTSQAAGAAAAAAASPARPAHPVVRHYENQAESQLGNVRKTLQGRGQTRTYKLKWFHNEVKRRLINRFSRGVEHHLDLACGR